MNWRIRRVRLEAVGPNDARYDDITLSFVADGRAAENGVVLLRNGGGKSLLLYLLFKALLPRRSDGTKTAEEQRKAGPVVLPDECATVAIEWEHRDERRLLITGHSFERGEGEETRWMLEPLEDVLTLDTLPLRDGARRRTRSALMGALDDFGKRYSRLRFRAVTGVGAWERELEGVGIDPQILRYQARLNRSEGGDDEELRFASPESFVRFVLQMVLDDDGLSSLQDRVQLHAEQLARRGALAADAEFCREAAGLLQTLATHHADVEARQADRQAAERGLAELAGVLEAAEAATVGRLDGLRSRREPLEQRRRDLETLERDLRREGNVLRARTDALLEQHAEAEHREAGAHVARAQVELDAWRIVDRLVRLHEVEGELAGLTAQVEAERRDIAAAQTQRAAAATALAGALLAAATEVADQAEAVDGEKRETKTEAARLSDALADEARRRDELQQRWGALDTELSTFERATARLREDGILSARERPSLAAARHEAALDEIRARRVALAERAATLRERQDLVGAEVLQLRDAVAEEQQKTDALRAAGADAVERVAAVIGDAVQDALDVDARFSPLAEPVAAQAALERARAAADTRRARAANQIEALEADERSLAHEQLLAVEPDVERICGVLGEAGIDAFPALRYLARAAPAHERIALIERRPGLASGIVLLGVAPAEALRALEEASTLPPRRPLVLASATTALSEDGGRAGALILPAPAAYDPEAAEAALEQLAASMQEFRARHGDETSLSDALASAALTLAAEADRLRSLLPVALQDEPSLLRAVDREVARLAAGVGELTREADEAAGRHGEIVSELSAVETEERQAAEQETALALALERLSSLDDVDTDAVRARLTRIQEHLRASSSRSTELGEARDEKLLRVQHLSDRQAALRAEHERFVAEARRLPADPDTARKAGDLPMLQRRYEVAEQALSEQIGDDELRVRVATAEERAGNLRSEIAGVSEDVQSRAAAMASSPRGRDPLSRSEGRRAAEEAHGEALEQRGVAKSEVEAARRRRRTSEANVSREDFARQPKVLEHLRPASIEEAQRLLARIEELRGQHEADAHANKMALETVDVQASAEESLRSEISTCRHRLRGDVVAHVGPLPAWTARRERVFEEAAQATERASRAADAHGAAQERMREHLTTISELVAGADERVSSGITATLRMEGLAADADRLQGELRTRAGELERTLAELDRHRRAIIGQLDAVASDAVRKLDRVAAYTTLPRQEALGAWAGKQFARVGRQVVTDETAREHQLGRLLDAAISTQARRRGLDLAFDATLAVCGGKVDVSVLKPHPQPDGRYHPIEKVGPEFSGGEELTIKLVLFFAVCAVRSAERSGRPRAGRRTGPLLIDNPIGTASRESLVDLQLRLARHLDAQFIPFTGLEGELNLTGRFATVVALTNDKDLLSGMRYVKTEDDAARMQVLPPRPPGTPEGAAVVSAINYTPAVDVVGLADESRRDD